MKGIFYVLFSLLPINAYLQPYVNFISTSDTSDVWMDNFSCWDPNCFFSSTKSYFIEGDTVINTVNYSKLQIRERYVTGIVSDPNCVVSDSVTSKYYGAFRENSKQIFIKKNGQQEYLAYDFNLSIGDTVPSPENIFGTDSLRIIDSTDQVMVGASPRKRYWIRNGNYIIEGIGSSTGLFQGFQNIISCTISMDCYSEYGVSIYFNMNCNPFLNKEENNKSRIKLFPNPAVDFIRIKLEEKQKIEYVILDHMGRKICTGAFENSSGSINVQHFDTGMYFIILKSDDSILGTHRFVKR